MKVLGSIHFRRERPHYDLRQALLVGTTWRIRWIELVASAVVAAEFVLDSDADPTVRFGLRLGKLNPGENGLLRPSAGVTAARCVGDWGTVLVECPRPAWRHVSATPGRPVCS